MSALSMIIALFVIFNSIGNVPIFIGLLKDFSSKKQHFIIIRELFFALLLMLLFSFAGEGLLSFLNLNLSVLRIGGGIILALVSLAMIFPKKEEASETLKTEPFIVPLATPIMAGPGTLSNVMIFSLNEPSIWVMIFCIFAAWLPSLCILLLSTQIQKLCGEKVLKAFERFAGMVLMFIAIQMLSTGLNEYIDTLGR